MCKVCASEEVGTSQGPWSGLGRGAGGVQRDRRRRPACEVRERQRESAQGEAMPSARAWPRLVVGAASSITMAAARGGQRVCGSACCVVYRNRRGRRRVGWSPAVPPVPGDGRCSSSRGRGAEGCMYWRSGTAGAGTRRRREGRYETVRPRPLCAPCYLRLPAALPAGARAGAAVQARVGKEAAAQASLATTASSLAAS